MHRFVKKFFPAISKVACSTYANGQGWPVIVTHKVFSVMLSGIKYKCPKLRWAQAYMYS